MEAVALFEKVARMRLADYERRELLVAAFEQRELRLGRTKHFDAERGEHRMLRRIDSHWGFPPKWVDAGPFEQETWERRFQEWQADATNEIAEHNEDNNSNSATVNCITG